MDNFTGIMYMVICLILGYMLAQMQLLIALQRKQKKEAELRAIKEILKGDN